MPPTFAQALRLPESEVTLRRRWLASRDYWCLQAVGGGLLLVNELNNALRPPSRSAWSAELPRLVFYVVCGLLCAHLLRWLILALRVEGAGASRSPWRWLWLAPATFAAACACAGNPFSWEAWIRPGPLSELLETSPASAEVSAESVLGTLIFLYLGYLLVWLGLYFGIQFVRYNRLLREGQLSLALSQRETELRALRSHLAPHFLFNALNTIRGLMPVEALSARDAITRLAALLRGGLTLQADESTTVAGEVELVRHYLEIERLRHGARLRASMLIGPGTASRLMPPFLLQGLVENAVKYGVEASAAGSRVEIETWLADDGALCLRVTNDGQILPGATDRAAESTGLGLAHARRQLALLHGDGAKLELRAVAGGLVSALVRIPHRPGDTPDRPRRAEEPYSGRKTKLPS